MKKKRYIAYFLASAFFSILLISFLPSPSHFVVDPLENYLYDNHCTYDRDAVKFQYPCRGFGDRSELDMIIVSTMFGIHSIFYGFLGCLLIYVKERKTQTV